MKARRLTRLALLVTVGLVLFLVERQFPPPAPVPGVRLGLANTATLAALALDGPGGAFLVWAVRFFLGQLAGGSLFGPGFVVGGAGGLLAWAAMVAVSFVWRPGGQGWVGTAGVSVAGAAAHHLGQLLAASAVLATPELMRLLPLMLALAVPVGLLTGAVLELLLSRVLGAAGGAASVGWGARPGRGAPPGGAAAGDSAAAGPLWQRLLRPGDLTLAAAIGVVAVGISVGWLGPAHADDGSPQVASVVVQGTQVATLDLSQNGLHDVPGVPGMKLEVRDGAIRVLESDCPDQICVLTGWVSKPGSVIACVPNQTVIRVGGGPDAVIQ